MPSHINQVCPVCKQENASGIDAEQDGLVLDCPCCGEFRIGREALSVLDGEGLESHRWKIAAWIRERQLKRLTTKDINDASVHRPPSLTSRARLALVASARASGGPGRPLAISWPYIAELQATTWSRDRADLMFLIDQVLIGELGWLQRPDPGVYSVLQLTPKGHIELERRPNAEAHTGFCAMSFAPALAGFYAEVIEAAIGASGYEPIRLDHTEHNNPIDDEIVAAIRAARFVVADLTGQRGGVYYEAGFAHGLGLPVIFMVREDDQEALHFDVQQQNFIVWQAGDLPEARRRLENRIRATLGQGPLDRQRS